MGAEEGHDPVARVLVDRPLEAVHALGEDLEEALQDGVPLLGIELLGELHGALHVRKQDGHLLAFAFEGGLRLEDLLGEVLGRVVARSALGSLRTDRRRGEGLGALAAELRVRGVPGTAPGADGGEGRPALVAEEPARGVLVAAGGTTHGASLPRRDRPP
jgi:hypothetical protein